MGVQPSKTELYLPSDTLRRCDPDRCWCDRPSHRKSRYVYVERGGDGSERYHDPMDVMMGHMMMGMGGGAAMPMPWKDPRAWTARDYDRLGEVLEEFYSRERGRLPPHHGSRPHCPPGYEAAGSAGPYPTWPVPTWPTPPPDAWWCGGDEAGGGARRRRANYHHHHHHPHRPGWPEYHRLEEQFRQMYDEYVRHRDENDSVLYGSEGERRKDRYRETMLRTLQEMWPRWGGQHMMMAAAAAAGAPHHPAGYGGGGGMMMPLPGPWMPPPAPAPAPAPVPAPAPLPPGPYMNPPHAGTMPGGVPMNPNVYPPGMNGLPMAPGMVHGGYAMPSNGVNYGHSGGGMGRGRRRPPLGAWDEPGNDEDGFGHASPFKPGRYHGFDGGEYALAP